jgi:pimeloyl-ACP methyl ester carboxylesterase
VGERAARTQTKARNDGHDAEHAAWPLHIREPAAQQRLEDAMHALLEMGGARVARGFEEHGNVRLHTLCAGDGEPMLLLHGAGGGAANWFSMFAPLSESFRVIAPDLPGFGFSPSLEVTPPLGMFVANAIDRWLEARGERRVHLVGTSLGGLIALRMAQCNPDRVRTITLLDAAGLGTGLPLLVRCGTLPGCARFVRRTSRTGLDFFLRRYLTASPMPAGRREALLDFLHAGSVAGGGETVARHLGRFATMAGQTEVLAHDALQSIVAPTLVLWGENDRFLPVRHAHRAARGLPHATLRIVRGVGHSPNWERPDDVAAAILEFARTHEA